MQPSRPCSRTQSTKLTTLCFLPHSASTAPALPASATAKIHTRPLPSMSMAPAPASPAPSSSRARSSPTTTSSISTPVGSSSQTFPRPIRPSSHHQAHQPLRRRNRHQRARCLPAGSRCRSHLRLWRCPRYQPRSRRRSRRRDRKTILSRLSSPLLTLRRRLSALRPRKASGSSVSRPLAKKTS